MARRIKRQPECQPGLFSPKCGECGRELVTTESGFLCCPMGHGRLVVEELTDCGSAERFGSWFAPDVPDGESR